MPTRWITASQPAMPWSRDSRDIMSPSIRSMAPRPRRSRSEPRRTRHRTAHPSARSAWTTARPTKPVPPVTKTRRIDGDCMALRISIRRVSIRSAADDKIGDVVVSLRPAVTLVLLLALALTSARASAQDRASALLPHGSGLRATPPSNPVSRGFPKAAALLAKLPYDYPPGSAFQYSDRGFILLGEMVRRVSGEPLDRYLERHVFKPLGLRDTGFNPSGRVRDRVAPTEFANGHLLVGEAHDPRARVLGGVAGHAGMFSTAWDLARICRMLVDGGALEGKRVFKSTTIATMWARSPEGNASRALGWDVSSSFSRTASPFFPPEAVGHLGFTGTSVWIDPLTRSYLILLTNRVHPSGGRP